MPSLLRVLRAVNLSRELMRKSQLLILEREEA